MDEEARKFRCPSRIFGVITENGEIEVKCGSKHCGAGNGVVVLHYFDMTTLELLRTKKFRDPKGMFQTQTRR